MIPPDHSSAHTEQRRRFIKHLAMTSAVLAASTPLSVLALPATHAELKLGSKIYRGTADGKILLSEDGGLNWRTLVQFGVKYRVEQLMINDHGSIKARLNGEHGPFWLKSKNDQHWFTESYHPPKIS